MTVVLDRYDRSLTAWHVVVFAVIAALLGGYLFLVTGPHLRDLSGGLQLLDLTFGGYGHAEIEAFHEAIGHEGVLYYASNHLIADMVFPIAAFLFLATLFIVTSRPGARFSVPLPEGLRLVVLALAGIAAICDVLENFALWAALSSGASGAVELASLLTMIKAFAYILALAGIVATLILALVRGVGAGEPARA